MELLYKLIQPISFFVIVYLLIVKENEKEGFNIMAIPAAAMSSVLAPAIFIVEACIVLIIANGARKGGLKNEDGKYIIPKVSIPLTCKMSNKYIIKHIKYYLSIYIYFFSFKWLWWDSFYTTKDEDVKGIKGSAEAEVKIERRTLKTWQEKGTKGSAEGGAEAEVKIDRKTLKTWQEKGTNLWMFFKGVGIFIYDIFVDLFKGSEPKKGFLGFIIRLFYLIFWWCYFIYFIFPFSLLIFSGGFIVCVLASLYNITIGVVIHFIRELKLVDNLMSLIK